MEHLRNYPQDKCQITGANPEGSPASIHKRAQSTHGVLRTAPTTGPPAEHCEHGTHSGLYIAYNPQPGDETNKPCSDPISVKSCHSSETTVKYTSFDTIVQNLMNWEGALLAKDVKS
ncbi:hypothetical protein MHBO_003528 [Bonamia ostreae]|uniref:Uncharacterized protein n=1 Tax=Bonamia ostreae TaxID=126728 RepID=A0ABV2AQR2_9EUKA